jgi:hypothetical protein
MPSAAHRPAAQRFAAALAVVVLIAAACTTGAGGGASPTPAGNGGGGAGGSSAGSGGGTTASGGASNACSLLSQSEIQSIVGFAVNAGVLQTSEGQSDCQWQDQANNAGAVGLTVHTYDDSLWQTMSSVPLAKPVSGIGDAAYKGYPVAGDLAIKAKGYEIDIAIADFSKPTSQIDAENLSLANLVLPRL